MTEELTEYTKMYKNNIESLLKRIEDCDSEEEKKEWEDILEKLMWFREVLT